MTNYFILGKLGARNRDKIATQFIPRPVQHELIPDDPQKYHFIEQPEEDSLVKGFQVSSQIQALQSLRKISLSRDEQQKKIKLIERQIKQAERLARSKPNDPQAKENLETLYTLRGMLVNLSAGR